MRNVSRFRNAKIGVHYNASTLGIAYALSGHLAEAMPLLERAIEQGASKRFMAFHALQLVYLGEAYVLAGRLQDALPVTWRALEFARAHQEQGHEGWALRLFGDIAMHRDPPEVTQAEASYRQALALAEALGMRPLQAHCHLGLGTLYAKIGQHAQARAALAVAIALYRAMDMTFWLLPAEAKLVQVESNDDL